MRAGFSRLFERLRADRRGNALILYALTLPALIAIIGFALDFGRAAQLRSALNAVADAAVLAALTPTMMAQSNSTAQSAAIAMFNAQAAGLQSAAVVTVTVSNPSNNKLIRNATVCYTDVMPTSLSSLFGMASLTVSNCASAAAQTPPNIDFYVLLDNSPSMSLPATQAGLTQMESLTLAQESGGCAFACHQASTNNGDTAGNPCADGSAPNQSNDLYCAAKTGGQIDNYALARKNSITLRLDELTLGLNSLMQTAVTTAGSSPYATPPNYRFSISSMDSLWAIGFTNLMPLTANYVSGWSTASSGFGVMEMWANNSVCANAACSSGGGVGDVNTNYDDALSKANALMPNPGGGSNQTSDSPQEVLFFVTDGVEDEENGGIRLIQEINAGTSTNYCNTIKNRGIKIAILYTEYLPVPVNSFYNEYVAPIQPDLGPALQSCASSGLFIDAAIGTDLSQALAQLFQSAVAAAYLTN